MEINEVVIASACRTAIGKFLGGLKDVPARDLAVATGKCAVERAGIEPDMVDEICMGQVYGGMQGSLPARQVGMRIGLPHRSSAVSVNQNCASAMRALEIACHNIILGNTEIGLVVGVENMSQTPYLLSKGRTGYRMGPGTLEDHMLYDGEVHVCLLSYPEIRDRLILLNGWSKTYAMTGWRLGYAVWPGKLYDYARKLAVNFHSCVNAAAQYAGLAALKGPQDEVTKMVAEFDKRRKVVVEGLNKLPGVTCARPKGAFYAFPNIKRTGWKAKELASALLDDAGVAIIGGPDFGILGEGYVRLSYANSTENILKALDRMGDFLARRKAA